MSASQYVIAGQEIIRITEWVGGSSTAQDGTDAAVGTSISFDISTKAIAVGPNSSFDRYNVYYYNPTNGLRIEMGSIAVGVPWIGRLDAFMSIDIERLEQPGKIYVTPQNNFDAEALTQAAVSRTVMPPMIDLLAYNTDKIVGLPTSRVDEFYDRAMILEYDPYTTYYFPFYGREKLDLHFYGSRTFAPGDLQPSVYGISLGNFQFAGGVWQPTVRQQLLAAANYTQNNIHYHYDGSSGKFEYIEIQFAVVNPGGLNYPNVYSDGGFRMWFNAYGGK